MILFDLEFNKPVEDREKISGINPYFDGHVILGGCFLTRKYPLDNSREKIYDEWIWNDEGSEKKLLCKIFKILKFHKTSQPYHRLLVGAGIANFDIPYLQEKFRIYKIATNKQIFEVFKSYTVVDLATAGAIFNQSPFIRNISHTKLSKIVLGETTKDNSKIVWELYDQKKFQKIEARTRSEIVELLAIFTQFSKQTKQNYVAPLPFPLNSN